MVCRMKSHQGRFQKKSFSCILCAFSRVFFLFCWEKCVFGWFSCCFHCCTATCVAFRPPLFYRLCRAPIMYICWLPNREIYITGTVPCSTGYSTSTVRLPSWYCPTFFCRSIVFRFSVSLRYVHLMFPVLLTRCLVMDF
jgi:hypothetical protein